MPHRTAMFLLFVGHDQLLIMYTIWAVGAQAFPWLHERLR